ncbi:MAG: 3'(2'),5'-bisphosphate nucleotidase [Rhodothermales bacterium]|nr:3'(2'),5'-bisphosphate nucleotidase [Rhodothermales bacterium]
MHFDSYKKEVEVALAAVLEAASLCQKVQATVSPKMMEKKDRSPVTVADFGSQALVCRAINEAFPDDPVIGEEDSHELRKPEKADLLAKVVSHVRVEREGATTENILHWIDIGGASKYAKRLWTLDPIDGTKGFLRKEQYAIALGLIENGKVVVAALCCPNLSTGSDSSETGVVFCAVRGEGTQSMNLGGTSASSVAVSTISSTAKARFCESVESGHSSHGDAAAVAEALGIQEDSVRLDSQAKYAIVARGDAEIYMRLPTRPGYVEKIWDHAAGMLVIEEAGGKVTDIHGNHLDFTHGIGLAKNNGVIATNGLVHSDVLAALSKTGVTERVV